MHPSPGIKMTYTVIYEKGPTSSGAYVPDLPGVITVGDSREEVERLIQEAIEFHLEGMREEGLAIAAPSSFAGVVDINSAAQLRNGTTKPWLGMSRPSGDAGVATAHLASERQ